MSCLCHYDQALLKFWFQTYLGHENSASYLKTKAGKTFSHHGHALVTLYVQFLCSDWSKFAGEFMRKIYAASWNLFTLTAEADRVLCQLVMFFNVFFHWMYKLKYSCYHIYLGFWLRTASLVKVGNPISDSIVFVFSLLVSLSNYCIWCLFFYM